MISAEASLHCFILQFVLWSGMWKGAEMDLIACAFRSDEMVHHTRWRVEVIVTISLPLFSSLIGNTGPFCSASEPCLDWSMMQVLQRSMEPWIPSHCPSSSKNPGEIVNGRSVVKKSSLRHKPELVMSPSKRQHVVYVYCTTHRKPVKKMMRFWNKSCLRRKSVVL